MSRLRRLVLLAFRPEPRDYFYCERNGADELELAAAIERHPAGRAA